MTDMADRQKEYNKKNSFGKRVRTNMTSQMGAVVICIVVTLSLAGIFSNSFGQVMLLIINSIIYYTAIYACMWDMGHRDSNRIRFGHEVLEKYRGLKISLVANTPVWAMWLVLVAGKLGVFSSLNEAVGQGIIVFYKLFNPQLWPLMNMTGNTVFFNKITFVQLAILFIAISIMPFLGQLFYILGIKDIAPLQKLIYKSDKKKSKK